MAGALWAVLGTGCAALVSGGPPEGEVAAADASVDGGTPAPDSGAPKNAGAGLDSGLPDANQTGHDASGNPRRHPFRIGCSVILVDAARPNTWNCAKSESHLERGQAVHPGPRQ